MTRPNLTPKAAPSVYPLSFSKHFLLIAPLTDTLHTHYHLPISLSRSSTVLNVSFHSNQLFGCQFTNYKTLFPISPKNRPKESPLSTLSEYTIYNLGFFQTYPRPSGHLSHPTLALEHQELGTQ